MPINPEILYVHPKTPMVHRSVLPISVPALMKRLPVLARGLYASELRDDDIRAARVILADIHWYLSLAGAADLARRVRAVNPEAVLVAGGATATLYARQIVDELGFDFVVRGDAEIPLPQLVDALLKGRTDLDGIPNLVGRDGFSTGWHYVLSREDLNENDFFDLSFFPSAREDVRKLHARNPGWPAPIFPWLVPFRGCPIDCPVCLGSITEQRRAFRRGFVLRAAGRVAEDLERLDRDPDIRFVNVLLDFLGLLPEMYSREALRRATGLLVHAELAAPPSPDALDLFLSRFRGGNIHFSADAMHLTSERPVDPARLADLISRVQRAKGYTAVLMYNGRIARYGQEYRETVAAVAKTTGCYTADQGYWWTDFPRPDEEGAADPNTLEKFINLSWRDRFPALNALMAMSRLADRFLPRFAAIGLRHAHYRLVQNRRLGKYLT